MQELEDLQAAALVEVAAAREQKRTVSITFKVSPSEARQLQARCQGLKRSLYIRQKLLEGVAPRPRAVMPPVNRDIYIQTTYMRTTLNQIAKAINMASKQGERLPLTQTYLEQLAHMTETLNQIRASLRADDATTDADGEEA